MLFILIELDNFENSIKSNTANIVLTLAYIT